MLAWINIRRKSRLLIQQHKEIETKSAAGVGDAAKVAAAPAPAKGNSWLSIGLIAFKFLKAAQVVKVALMAASVAVYSVMFTLEFALALVGVLVFHEYGHTAR